MRLFYITIISFISLIAGIAFLAIEQEWIIIRMPWNVRTEYHIPGISKQKITLYYWNKNQLAHQTKELIIADDLERKLTTIIAGWLTVLHDEKIIPHKVTLQSVFLNPHPNFNNPGLQTRNGPDDSGRVAENTHLYISFDQPLFDKQQSTHSKWMLLQSLIKTIKENATRLSGIYFLVNHQVMQDEQLDFSNAWMAAR